MKKHALEFPRAENGGGPEGYNYRVIVAGEFRGTWKKQMVGRGWYLCDLAGGVVFEPTPGAGRGERVVSVDFKEEFVRVVARLLIAGTLPTAARCEERKREYAETEARIAREEAAREAQERVERHGPALLAALKDLLDALPDRLHDLGAEAREVVAKAEGRE